MLFLALSFYQVAAQTPGGDPYPIDTPTLQPIPVGSPTPTVEGEELLTPFPTPEREGFETPTPTLIPLPTLTLIFPAFSPTPSPTSTPTQERGNDEEENLFVQIDERIDRQVESIGILIVLIWLLLGVFLILYLKRLGY
jgi:hypothetical protein